MKDFGNRLKMLRIKSKHDLSFICNSIDVTIATWYHWENGYNYPPMIKLLAIVKFFNVSIGTLFDEHTSDVVHLNFVNTEGSIQLESKYFNCVAFKNDLDCLSPRICCGDILIVDPTQYLNVGKTVLISCNYGTKIDLRFVSTYDVIKKRYVLENNADVILNDTSIKLIGVVVKSIRYF